jgi:hypothetical protein
MQGAKHPAVGTSHHGDYATDGFGVQIPLTSTKLFLVTGDRLEVEGRVEEVGKQLQDASRSSSGTLAWLKEPGTDRSIGVNPAHVVTLSPGDE